MSENTVERLVYIGRRTNLKGEIIYGYRSIDGAEPGRVGYYTAQLTPTPIGSVVEITHPEAEATTYYSQGPNGPRVIEFSTEATEAELLSWQVADRAAYAAKADADAIKRAAKRADLLEANITLLTDAAARLTGYERAAFARYVAYRIRGV